MAIPTSTLAHIYLSAFDTFVERDIQLIHSNAHEQSWSHRIAAYMEDAAKLKCPGYHVDCEYNRNGDGVKQIRTLEGKIVNITCDIILHSRGSNHSQDNLIAIEIKKSNRPPREKKADRTRIQALTMGSDGQEFYAYGRGMLPRYVCEYGLGIYLEYDVVRQSFTEEVYEGGILMGVAQIPLAAEKIRASLSS